MLHGGGRIMAAILLVGSIVARWRSRTPEQKRLWNYVLVCAVLCPLAVALAKNASAHSCPWDLRLFGGSFEFFQIGAPVSANPGPGRCMPSGHASTGFMWLALLHVLYLLRKPKRYKLALIGFALLCGAAQVARGAHFASHILLTLALCALITQSAAWLMLRRWAAANALG